MAALCETFFPSLDPTLAREAGEESVAVFLEAGAHTLGEVQVVDEVHVVPAAKDDHPYSFD